METYKTSKRADEKSVMFPFISGLFQDICELYPEYDFSYEKAILEKMFKTDKELNIALELSVVGKELERSLIAPDVLQFDSLPTFTVTKPFAEKADAERGVLPRFLYPLWEELFFEDGYPRWLTDDSATMSLSQACLEELSDPRKHTMALAVVVLRQFLLGFSKLATLECLRRSNVGDKLLCRPDYCKSKPHFGDPCTSLCAGFVREILLRRLSLRYKAQRQLSAIYGVSLGCSWTWSRGEWRTRTR